MITYVEGTSYTRILRKAVDIQMASDIITKRAISISTGKEVVVNV
jgi:hypothetical protein